MMTDRPAARRVLMTFCFDPQHVSKTDWRIHCGAGVTESSTNKQHHLGTLSLLRQHAHTHTQTHTRAHTHTHKSAHTHTHACMYTHRSLFSGSSRATFFSTHTHGSKMTSTLQPFTNGRPWYQKYVGNKLGLFYLY